MLTKNLSLTLSLAVMAVMFSGCAGDPIAPPTVVETDISFNFDGQRLAGPQQFTAPVNLKAENFPSKGAIEGKLQSHPGEHTAFDQLLVWKDGAGVSVSIAYFQGIGFYLERVDGIPSDRNMAYWELQINGEPSNIGMASAILETGDEVKWLLKEIAPPEEEEEEPEEEMPEEEMPETTPLALIVDTQNLTTTDSFIIVNGSVNKESHVTLSINDHGTPAVLSTRVNGTWSFPIALGFGASQLVVMADDGTEFRQIPLEVVRLGRTTLEVNYNEFRLEEPTETFELWINIDANPSTPYYEPNGYNQSQNYTVHDQLAQLTADHGIAVEYAYSESMEGYSVCSIDGQGQCLSASAPPYWCFTINSEASEAGISLARVEPGQHITWDLGDCALVPV